MPSQKKHAFRPQPRSFSLAIVSERAVHSIDVAKHFRVLGRRASELVGGHFNCGVMRAFPFRFQVDEEVGVNQTLLLSQCCSPLFKWLGSRQKEVRSGSITSPSHRAKCLHAFP